MTDVGQSTVDSEPIGLHLARLVSVIDCILAVLIFIGALYLRDYVVVPGTILRFGVMTAACVLLFRGKATGAWIGLVLYSLNIMAIIVVWAVSFSSKGANYATVVVFPLVLTYSLVCVWVFARVCFCRGRKRGAEAVSGPEKVSRG